MVRKAFGGNNLLKIITIPDIEGVVVGRTPGYSYHQIRLSPELESISGTRIRNAKAKKYKEDEVRALGSLE
jgi:hypothetical protein